MSVVNPSTRVYQSRLRTTSLTGSLTWWKPLSTVRLISLELNSRVRMQHVTETVKPRAARTRATRRRIVDAAAELFIERGYGVTTLEQIAARAGVAVQTVYFHFGNKRTVLKEAVDVAAVGDDEQVALLERPWLEELRAEPDPRRVVELWMVSSTAIYTRIGPIMAVVRDAAVTDPEMAAQWATNEEQRATAFGELATRARPAAGAQPARRRGGRRALRAARPGGLRRAHRAGLEPFAVGAVHDETITAALLA